MTALLSCDGCGAIVSDRPGDDDPTSTWWCLSAAPAFGVNGLLPIITFTETIDDDPPDEIDLPEPEPDRHFCCVGCVGAWVGRRSDDDSA